MTACSSQKSQSTSNNKIAIGVLAPITGFMSGVLIGAIICLLDHVSSIRGAGRIVPTTSS